MSIKQYIEEKFQVTESLKLELVKGQKYEIPSGVGGVFPIEYMGKENGRHKFKNLNKEWSKSPIWKFFMFTDDQIDGNVKPAKENPKNFGL